MEYQDQVRFEGDIMPKKKLGAKKIIWIILTIIILGPMVFIGSCLPLGLAAYSVGESLIWLAFVFGGLLTIFVVYNFVI